MLRFPMSGNCHHSKNQGQHGENKGLNHAEEELEPEEKDGKEEGKEEGREIEIVIGSETPRFWPGLPVEFGENVKAWFGKRGMLISTF